MTERVVTGKRNRISKNKKKAWKKVNTDEVEKALEDERLQQRTGYVYPDLEECCFCSIIRIHFFRIACFCIIVLSLELL